MPIKGKILIIFVVLAVLIFIFELLRRKKVTEAVTLWWLFIVVGLITLTVFDEVLVRITMFIGAGYPITTMILFSIIFVFLMLVYFSMKICVLSRQLQDVAQYIAIMKTDLINGKYNKKDAL